MKTFKNLLLLILSIVLAIIIIPISLIFSFSKHLIKSGFKAAFCRLGDIFWQFAVSIDQAGNSVCPDFFDATLIKDDTICGFGNEDETISSVIGRNKKINNLTKTGIFLDWLLDKAEKDHSIKSIGA